MPDIARVLHTGFKYAILGLLTQTIEFYGAKNE